MVEEGALAPVTKPAGPMRVHSPGLVTVAARPPRPTPSGVLFAPCESGVICWPSGWPRLSSSPSAALPSTAARPPRRGTIPLRRIHVGLAGGRSGCLRRRGRQGARDADDRHRLPGLPPGSRERPDQRQGLRVRRRVRRRRPARLHRRPGQWVKVPFNNVLRARRRRRSTSTSTRSRSRRSGRGRRLLRGLLLRRAGRHHARRTPSRGVTLADLKGLKLGAQTGTTSLTAIREDIQPDAEPLVFDNTNVAKQALLNGQVDAIVADLPTAFYITAVEIPQGTITGQFQPSRASPRSSGCCSRRAARWSPCVDEAIAALKDDGTLAADRAAVALRRRRRARAEVLADAVTAE